MRCCHPARGEACYSGWIILSPVLPGFTVSVCVQTEAFAFMPSWMGTAFVTRGANGWWTLRPPAMVMAHVVWLPYDKIFKAYIFKALGLWNWEAETVGGPPARSHNPTQVPSRLQFLAGRALPFTLHPGGTPLNSIHEVLAYASGNGCRTPFCW